MADEPKSPLTLGPQMPSEVEFFFEYDKDYRIVAANGVWGGFTPRGDIRLDFFVEGQSVPESIQNKITEDGKLGAEIAGSRKPEKKIVRRLQIGVLLSQEEADSLANFIKGRLAELETIKGMK